MTCAGLIRKGVSYGDDRTGASNNEVKKALKGSQAPAIKTASEKLDETWQAVSAELFRAVSEKASAGQGLVGGQSGMQPQVGGVPEGSKNGENPIIDAEVVDEKKEVNASGYISRKAGRSIDAGERP
jgi:hypothetical protein